MPRVVLHDDFDGYGDQVERIVSNLDSDPVIVETNVNPLVTVRIRLRTGWSADGDPEFSWSDVVTANAVLWDENTELDSVAGVTKIVSSLVVLYSGDEVVRENCVVVTPFGLYECVSVDQFPDRLEMKLTRTEDLDAG